MKAKIPGISLSLCLAIIAAFIGQHYPVMGGPVVAIALGVLIAHFFPLPPVLQPGLAFSARYILQTAVVFLGFGLNLKVIAQTTVSSLPIILSTISVALLAAYFLQKIWQIEPQLATLIGVGSAICGGSAIAATAPIIRADNEKLAQSISVIFFYNLLAALLFPTLGGWLGFATDSGQAFGTFAGSAINDTSSVTAAASAWDQLHQLGHATLHYAVTVKLTRTLFIIPIALGLSLIYAKKDDTHQRAWYHHVPLFLILFLAASLLSSGFSSLGYALPGAQLFKSAAKFLIIVAMAAIGLQTRIKALIQSGIKPLALGFVLWFLISVTSLIMQHFMGYW